VRSQIPRIVINESGRDLQVPLGRVAYRRDRTRGASEMLAICIAVSNRFDGLAAALAGVRSYRRASQGKSMSRVFNRLWPVCT
jgi:hypothetical protein